MASDEQLLVERIRHRVTAAISGRTAISIEGSVRAVRGDGITALVPAASVGEMASIERPMSPPVRCVVVGVEGNKAFLSPLDDTARIAGGAAVQLSSARLHLSLQQKGLFQMIDSMGDDIHQSDMHRCGMVEEPEKKL
jgi:flagellar biosynthesis/type III secretory pathway ATPase